MLDESSVAEQAERIRRETERTPAKVPVTADTDTFKRRVEADIKRITAAIEANVPVTAEGEQLRRDVEREISAIRENLAVDVPLDLEDAAAWRARVLRQVQEAERVAESVTPTVEIDAKVDTVSVRTAARDASNLATVSGQLAVSAAHVGAALLTWGPPILLAAAAVVAMAPAVATLLPLIVGVAGGVAAVAIAAKGLGKAFAPFVEQLKGLQRPITQTVTQGLRPLIRTLGTGLIPVLRQGLTGFAELANTVLRGLLGFAGSAEGLRLIGGLLNGVSAAMRPLAVVVAPLARAFLQLATAALPGLRLLTQALADVALRFAAWVDQGTRSGEFARAISGAVTTAGAILRSFGAALRPILDLLVQLAPVGAAAFAAIGPAIGAAVKAITPFVLALTQNRVLLAAVALAVAAFVGPVATVVAGIALLVAAFQRFAGVREFLAPVIAGVQSFALYLQTAFETVRPAVEKFAAALLPTLLEIGTQIRNVVAPALSQIGEIIATQVAPAFAAFLTAVTPVANFLLKVLGSAVVGALKGAVEVIKGVLVVIAGVFNALAGLLTGDWSRLWEGLKQIVSGAFQAIIGLVRVFLNLGILKLFKLGLVAIRGIFVGGWAAIRAVWSGALNGIRSLAGSVLRGIASLIVGAVRGYIGLWRSGLGLIRSAVTSGFGALRGIASAALSAMRGAVSSGISTVLGVVRRIPGQIRASLGNLAGLLLAAGRAVVDGLVRGITGAAGRVADAARSLASKIPGPIAKVLGIASPSKVTRQFGAWVGQGLVQGMTGTVAQVQAAARRLATNVSAPLRRATEDEVRGLTALARQREAVAKSLKAATDKLTAAVKLRDDFAKSIREGILALGDVTRLGANGAGTVTAASIVDDLTSKLDLTKAFQRNIAKLKRLGINNTTLKQILDAGVEAGGATAKALLEGGDAAVTRVNELTRALANQAKSLGASASRHLYQAGVDSAAGLVRGLQSRAGALADAARRLAITLVRELRKQLKIKSPSAVMARDVGRWIPLGVQDGIERHRAGLDRTVRDLVRVPTVRRPAFDFAGRAGPWGGLTIHGNVGWDADEVARQMDVRQRDAAAVASLAAVL